MDLVLGNVSGDMDSVVGAVALGFYLTHKHKSLHVPVVNMTREELRARLDIVHHFEQCGLNVDELPSLHDFTLDSYKEAGTLSIHLVDHNAPDCF